jgi:hypothetical protein
VAPPPAEPDCYRSVTRAVSVKIPRQSKTLQNPLDDL